MTKNEKKNLLIGFLAVLILSGIYAGILLWQQAQQKKQQQKAGQEAQDQVLLALDTSQIRQIVFGSDPQVTLIQTADGFGTPADPDFTASESRISQMLKDLSGLEMTRQLTDIDVSDLNKYGLEPPQSRIDIMLADGTEHQVSLGDHSDASKELYIQVDDDDAVYLTKTALDEHFSGDLNALASYEAFPAITASQIREIEVVKDTGSFTLTTPGDDSCTVTDAEGNTQNADVGLAGAVQMDLANSTWLKNLEYHCKDLKAYGLDEPAAEIRISSKRTQEGQSHSADLRSDADGNESANEVVILLVGDTDASGNYYVCLKDSAQVHTIRREYLESLVEGGPQTFWSRNYSFVSIGDLDHLDVTMDGVTHTLRRVSENGGQTDEDLTWYVDEKEVSKERFTDFYYACVSVTAQERLGQIPEFTEEPALTLHYFLNDGTEKLLAYYLADQNFYTVVYDNGQSAANTNRLYVNTMIESYRELLEYAG